MRQQPQREWTVESLFKREALQQRLLLLPRHNAKTLNAQEGRLATSPQLVTRLQLPHAVVVRLHVRQNGIVILIPQTVVYSWCLSSSLSLSVRFSIQDEAMDVARSAPQGAHYYADVTYLPP